MSAEPGKLASAGNYTILPKFFAFWMLIVASHEAARVKLDTCLLHGVVNRTDATAQSVIPRLAVRTLIQVFTINTIPLTLTLNDPYARWRLVRVINVEETEKRVH